MDIFNILRMFPHFRLTKSDNCRCFLERMTGSFLTFVPSLSLCLSSPSRAARTFAIDRIGGRRTRSQRHPGPRRSCTIAISTWANARLRSRLALMCFLATCSEQCLMNVQLFCIDEERTLKQAGVLRAKGKRSFFKSRPQCAKRVSIAHRINLLILPSMQRSPMDRPVYPSCRILETRL